MVSYHTVPYTLVAQACIFIINCPRNFRGGGPQPTTTLKFNSFTCPLRSLFQMCTLCILVGLTRAASVCHLPASSCPHFLYSKSISFVTPASSSSPRPLDRPTLFRPSMIPGPGTKCAFVMSDQSANGAGKPWHVCHMKR